MLFHLHWGARGGTKRSVMNGFLAVIFVLSVGAFAGCRNEKPVPPPSPANTPGTGVPQPRLQTIDLLIGPHQMKTEVALNQKEHNTGMMFRTNIAEFEGMLFVFPAPTRTGFWMKNTLIPLSIAYINANGSILEIHDLHPHNTNTVLAASANVQYALETAQGWFHRNAVMPGDQVRTSKGTLAGMFGRGR